jgi:hypothetical protein
MITNIFIGFSIITGIFLLIFISRLSRRYNNTISSMSKSEKDALKKNLDNNPFSYRNQIIGGSFTKIPNYFLVFIFIAIIVIIAFFI